MNERAKKELADNWLELEMMKLIEVYGVSRMADNGQAVLVSFSRKLDDNDLRSLHDYLRNWHP